MPDWAIQLLMAGAIYGGIRADLRNIKECAEAAKREAGKAHERIDVLLSRGQ